MVMIVVMVIVGTYVDVSRCYYDEIDDDSDGGGEGDDGNNFNGDRKQVGKGVHLLLMKIMMVIPNDAIVDSSDSTGG